MSENTKTAFPFNMTNMIQEQMGQMQAAAEQWQAVQDKSITHAQTTMDEMNKLARASFGYQMELAKEWQKLSMDFMQQFTKQD